MVKPLIIILAVVAIAAISAVVLFQFGGIFERNGLNWTTPSNNRYFNNGTNWEINNPQSSGPTIPRSDADTGGFDVLPFNTCPDKIVSQYGKEKTILTAMLDGKEYAVQGQDWIKANCDPNLWVFELPRNMTKEDYLKLLPSCGTNNELFSVVPVDINKLVAIIPLGNFNPPGGHVYPTDHVYFSSGQVAFNPTTLYAPGNGWIMEIRKDTRATGEEYIMIDFAPCREVVVRFDHVKSISQKLADKFVEPYDSTDHYVIGGTTRDVKTKLMNVSVSSGEILGVAGGGDWSTFDKRNTNVFANPTRYLNYSFSNATCPIDYYTPALKTALAAKLGKFDGSVKRTIEPICGQVAQDIPDTAQGIWVKVGGEAFADTNQEQYQLTLAYDNINPKTGVFAVGTSISDVPTSIYTFTPASSGLVNRDFKDVKSDGNVYCYDVSTIDFGNTVNSFIIQLTSSTTLKIARHYSSCGSGPWTFSQYTDFER